MKLCATGAAAISASALILAQGSPAPLKLYQRVRLTNSLREPLKAAQLASGASYIFNYPYATTPYF